MLVTNSKHLKISEEHCRYLVAATDRLGGALDVDGDGRAGLQKAVRGLQREHADEELLLRAFLLHLNALHHLQRLKRLLGGAFPTGRVAAHTAAHCRRRARRLRVARRRHRRHSARRASGRTGARSGRSERREGRLRDGRSRARSCSTGGDLCALWARRAPRRRHLRLFFRTAIRWGENTCINF